MNFTNKQILNQVRQRVGDPRYVAMVRADLAGADGSDSGMNCSEMYEQILGVARVLGAGRGNYYNAGLRECKRGYRLGGFEWCQEALDEAKVRRAQQKEDKAAEKKASRFSRKRKRRLALSDRPSSTAIAIDKGVTPIGRVEMPTPDLEDYAGSTLEELLNQRRWIQGKIASLQKDLQTITVALLRLKQTPSTDT